MAVSHSNVSEFAAQGYTVARGLFSVDEVARLRRSLRADESREARSY